MIITENSVYDRDDTLLIIKAALQEDLLDIGDITVDSLVSSDARLATVVTAKDKGIVTGMPIFQKVFDLSGGGVEVSFAAPDGTEVEVGDVVLKAEGLASTTLKAERTALNIAQRLSGVSTTTSVYAKEVEGTEANVFDTRKTAPGMRFLQKRAVLAGNGKNHRMGLFDMVLIKENHIALMDSSEGDSAPEVAVAKARKALGPDARIETEIEKLEDLEPVIQAGADIVMLDNMEPDLLRKAVEIRGCRKVELEASGGITIKNLRSMAETGVERISIGALTHSVVALDLSMRCTII